jgi:S-adenosylmethionine:diacylglycerol 3-amino-3-carboxypropyl transferase
MPTAAFEDEDTARHAVAALALFALGPDMPLERKLPAELIGRWNYMADEAQRFHDQDRSSIYGGFHIYELKGN